MFDPQQALLNLLQPGGPNQTLFPPTSRYYGIPTATLTGPDGSIDLYLTRRFLPPLETTRSLLEHTVTEGERLDHVAFRYLADPEQFWRVADANTEMNALELTTTPGRVLRIPLEGAL